MAAEKPPAARPAAAPPAAPVPPRPDRAPAHKPPDRPVRVLIAEDEHLVAAHLASQLGELGYTVMAATDGEEALALAKSWAPDLALFDIRMPRRDGISAAREVFESLAIPVVIISAYSDTAQTRAAEEAGVFGYVVKPARTDQLRATIDVAWGAYRRHMEAAASLEQMARRLEDRKVIEQAKWLLVSRKGMTEPDAARHLNHTARNTRRSTLEVAMEVVRTLGTA